MALQQLNEASVPRRFVAGVAAALLVVGCATGPKYGPDSPVTTIVVPVERLAYPPLVPKLPITVGVYYPPELRGAVVMAGGGDTPRFRLEIGAAAVALIDENFAALFARKVELPGPSRLPGNAVDVDLILAPRFQSLPASYLLALDVLAPDGSRVATIENWAMTPLVPKDAVETSNTRNFIAGNAYLVDAVGDLAMALVLSSDIVGWAQSRDLAWRWQEVPSPSFDVPRQNGVVLVVCDALLRRCQGSADSVAVGEALRKLDPAIGIVQAEDFRRALYPWLGWAERSEAQVAEWLRRPAVAARAASVGVRYLVFADTLHASTQAHGGMGAVGGYGGGGFFGLMWWTRNEVGRLNVFDFVAAANAGTVSHRRDDVTFALPVLIIPVPIPLPRQAEDMPDAIAKQLLPLVRPPH